MSQIRAKQIRLNNQGDLIIGNSLGNGSILSIGDIGQVLHVAGSSVSWEWPQTLYDVSGNLILDTLPSPGSVNYLNIGAGTSGNGPLLQAVGYDSDIDIRIFPAGTGEILAPLSYTNNIVSENALVTKQYVDSVAAGLDWKNSVRVATVSPADVSAFSYDVSAEPTGFVWTNVVSPVVIDGYTLVSGDRILIKDAADPRGNGIFIYDATNQAFVRASDANNSPGNEVSMGLAVFVETGSVNSSTAWVLIEPNSAASLGVDNLTFTQFAGTNLYIAGPGLSLTGNVFSVNTSTTIEVVNDSLIVNSSNIPNQVLLSQGALSSEAVWGALPLDDGNAVTGILNVANGGTGLNSVPTGNILVGTGTSSLGLIPPTPATTSAIAYVLRTNFTGTNVAFSPIDLNQLSDVDVSGAVAGDLLRFNGTEWVPASAAVTDRLVAVNSAATPGFLVDVLVATTSGAITFVSAGNTLEASVNYDDSRIINVGGNLTVGNGVTGQVLIGTGSALAANWGYLDTLRNTTGSALFTATGTGTGGTFEVSAEGAVLRQGGDSGLSLVATSGYVFIDSVRYPKIAPAHSVLVANTDNILTSLTTGGNENRILVYNAATSAFAFVSAGFIGVSDSFGVFALSGNFTGSTTVSATSPNDTLTLIGGNGINLTGDNTSRNITVAFANVNMSSVPVEFDDKAVFFDTSNSDKPEHRTFKGIFNDLSVPHNLTALGFAAQVSAGEWQSRTIVASTSADRTGIEVLNGDGTAGNPRIGLNIEGLTEINQTVVSADTDYVVLYKETTDQNVRTKVSALIFGTIDHTRIWDTANTTYVDTDEIANTVLVKSYDQRVATFVGSNTATSARNYFEFDTGTSADSVRIEAVGTEADINIRLLPKGNGNVLIGETTGPGYISTELNQDLVLQGGRNIQLIPTSVGSFLGEVKIYAASSAELVVFDDRKVRQYNVGNANSYKDSYVIRLSTTNTATARYSIKLPNNSTVLANAYVVGLGDSNTNRLGMKLDALCYVVASTASILDNVAQTLVAASGGPLNATFVVSGDSIELEVLGASAVTNWTGFIDIVTVI